MTNKAKSDVTMDDNPSNELRVFQSRDQTRAYYDKISRFYDLLADHSEHPMREAGLQEFSAKEGENILEIGYGTGHCLVELAQAVGANGRVYGLDLSEGMREVARQRLQEARLLDRVQLDCGDAAGMDYPSESIDAVFMSFTLELFDTAEIPKVLNECLRVLRAGGRLVVVGMSKEGNQGALVHIYEWTHKHFPNFMDCRPIFVRQAIEAAGFEILSAEQRSMWVPVEIIRARKPKLSCFFG
jgi:demethylmenaquinone methyltransferase/2-methoxy-6-polyprenyl-1,4-benzoquinol methylase